MATDLSYSTFINDPIDELHTLYGDVFLGAGTALQSAVEVIIFGLYLMAYGPNLVAVFRFFIRYVLRMTFVHFVLNYYYKPIGFLHTNLSFHQVPPAVCDYFVSQLDMRRMDVMFAYLQTIMLHMDVPAWNWQLDLSAKAGTLMISIFQAACWFSIGISYIAVGVFTLLLPLVVWTLMIPGLSHMFWNAWNAIWQNAFYRIMASAIVFCASTSVMAFMFNSFHGNYDPALFVALLGKMLALMFTWVAALFRIGTWVSDFWRGSSSGSAGFGNFVSSMRKGL
jgi:hypothetical protein